MPCECRERGTRSKWSYLISKASMLPNLVCKATPYNPGTRRSAYCSPEGPLGPRRTVEPSMASSFSQGRFHSRWLSEALGKCSQLLLLKEDKRIDREIHFPSKPQEQVVCRDCAAPFNDSDSCELCIGNHLISCCRMELRIWSIMDPPVYFHLL